MKHAVAIACLSASLLLGVARSGIAHPPPTVEDVLASIKENGAGQALELFCCEEGWDSILDGIASGDPQWLAVAREFIPVSDVDSTETLLRALHEALAPVPGEVLALVARSPFDVKGICGSPGFEYDNGRPRPIAKRLELLKRQRQALSAVSKPALAAPRRECLQELKQVEIRLKQPR